MAPKGTRRWPRWFDASKVSPHYFQSELTWSALLLHLAGLALFVSLLALEPVSRFLGVGPLAALGLVLLNAVPQTLMTARAQRRGGRHYSLVYEIVSVHANFCIVAGFLALSQKPLTPLWAFHLLYVGVVAQCFGFQPSFLPVVAAAGLVPGLCWQLQATGGAGTAAWMASGAFTFIGLWQYLFVGNLRDQARSLGARARELEQQQRLDRERDRLAREIHDGLGSQLAGAILASHVALCRVMPAASRAEMSTAAATLRQKIERAERELQLALWPGEAGPAPLSTVAELFVHLQRSLLGVCRASQVSLLTRVSDRVDAPLTAFHRHHMTRILEEAASNSLSHARPRHLELSARQLDGVLELTVQDDGVGLADAGTGAGRGIPNMHRRARELGGSLVISSLGSSGTAVSVRVPLVALAAAGAQDAGEDMARSGDGRMVPRRATGG